MFEIFLSLLGGLLTGLLLSRIFYRSKAALAVAQLKADSTLECVRLTEQLSSTKTNLAHERENTVNLEAEVDQLNDKILQLSSHLAETQQLLRSEQEKIEQFHDLETKFTDTFKAISSEALQASNKAFFDLATATFDTLKQGASGELKQRKKEIDFLVEPLRKSLEKVDAQMQQIERNRLSSFSQLNQQIESLQDNQSLLKRSADNLVKALRRPTVRGRWGEIQLKKVVEMAGMVEHCDFVQQSTLHSDTGRLRPDMIVQLPGGRSVIVDSKVPLSAYLEAVETDSEDERTEHLKHHAQQVRNHLLKLSEKAYWNQFDSTPEFVILFLPGETFFSAALEQSPELIEFGVQHRVIIATPTTLIALLRSVAFGWKQDKLTQNAQEISNLGKELYDRIRTMASHMCSLKKGLDSAVDGYNKTVGSFESRVLVSARKFKELGASSGDIEISTVEQVEKTPRHISPDVIDEDSSIFSNERELE